MSSQVVNCLRLARQVSTDGSKVVIVFRFPYWHFYLVQLALGVTSLLG